MNIKSPFLFVFDCDGVIADTAQIHFEAWKQCINNLGISISDEYLNKLRGISRMECLDIIINDYNIILSKLEFDELCKIKNEIYIKKIKNDEVKIIKPIIDLIVKLKKNNFLVAIASSSLNAKLILIKMNIISYIDYIVDPIEIKFGKPNPEIFLNAFEYFNLDARDVICFEDAKNGIDAINASGAFSVGIGYDTDIKNTNLHYCDANYINIDEILDKYHIWYNRKK